MQTKIFEWNKAGTTGTNRLFGAVISFDGSNNAYSVTVNGRTLKTLADSVPAARKLAEHYSKTVMTRLLSGE